MRNSSFTLIELLIVIAIIAILVGAMVPIFRTTKIDAQRAKVMADFEGIKTAYHLFHLDTGIWPCASRLGQGSVVGLPGIYTDYGDCWFPDPYPNWNGPYLSEPKNDPYGKPYCFYYCGPGNTAYFYVLSTGPNGIADPGASCGVNGMQFQGDDIATLIAKIIR